MLASLSSMMSFYRSFLALMVSLHECAFFLSIHYTSGDAQERIDVADGRTVPILYSDAEARADDAQARTGDAQPAR